MRLIDRIDVTSKTVFSITDDLQSDILDIAKIMRPDLKISPVNCDFYRFHDGKLSVSILYENNYSYIISIPEDVLYFDGDSKFAAKLYYARWRFTLAKELRDNAFEKYKEADKKFVDAVDRLTEIEKSNDRV